jgi:hypothetical protein
MVPASMIGELVMRGGSVPAVYVGTSREHIYLSNHDWQAAGLILFATWVATVLVVLATTIMSFAKLHRGWKLIQPLRGADPSESNMPEPEVAIGFLFIPFYNFYWLFVAKAGLARRVNKFIRVRSLPIAPMSETLAIILCMLQILLLVIPLVMIIDAYASRSSPYANPLTPQGIQDYGLMEGIAGLGVVVLEFAFILSVNRVSNAIIACPAAMSAADQPAPAAGEPPPLPSRTIQMPPPSRKRGRWYSNPYVTGPVAIASCVIAFTWATYTFCSKVASVRNALNAMAPDAADYCTVLLAPKLLDDLEHSAPERIQMAFKMREFQDTLATSDMFCRNDPPSAFRELEAAGETVRRSLRPAQDRKFQDMFRDAALKHVQLVVVPGAGNPPFAAALAVQYTAYKEQDPVGRLVIDNQSVPLAGRPSQTPSKDEFVLSQIRSVDDALGVLEGDHAKSGKDGDKSAVPDHDTRNCISAEEVAAGWLTQAKVDDSLRPRVLSALRLRISEEHYHLTTGQTTPSGRDVQPFVKAYCHWTGPEQAEDLMGILDIRISRINRSEFDRMIGERLIEIDYDNIDKLIKDGRGGRQPESRKYQQIEHTLEMVASGNSPHAAQASEILHGTGRQPYPPRWTPSPTSRPAPILLPVKKVIASLDQAIAALATDKEMDNYEGAAWLDKADFTGDADREKARQALRPHLAKKHTYCSDVYFNGYCHYATQDDVPMVVESLRKGSPQLATSVRTLIRLDPKACRTEIENHAQDGDFWPRAAAGFIRADSSCESAMWLFLQSDNARLRLQACITLRNIGTHESIGPIEKTLVNIADEKDRAEFKIWADRAIEAIAKRAAKQ